MRKQFKIFGLIVIATATAVAFQNCQPYAAQGTGSASQSSNGGGTPGGGTPGGPTMSVSEKFFVENVRTTFQSKCAACHNEPRLVTGTAATLGIYNYQQMKASLSAGGTTIASNNLVRKTSDQIAHVGGNMCSMGVNLNDPVCGMIIQWHQKEFPSSVAGLSGQLLQVSFNGQITGWAMNPVNPAAKIRVYFYIDGPVGTGTAIGNTLANLNDVGQYSGNYYSFQIPTQYIDNRTHQLFLYLGEAVAANLSPETPLNYGAYVLTPAAQQYFNNTIKPTTDAQCNSCHVVDINAAYANVMSPTPANNGTATNNNFIMNASGNDHPFNGCGGGLNSGLCANIQTWWRMLFP